LSEAEKAQSKSYSMLTQVPMKTGAAIDKIKPVFKDFWDKMDRIAVPVESEDGQSEQEQ
jgi:hypothetical protein